MSNYQRPQGQPHHFPQQNQQNQFYAGQRPPAMYNHQYQYPQNSMGPPYFQPPPPPPLPKSEAIPPPPGTEYEVTSLQPPVFPFITPKSVMKKPELPFIPVQINTEQLNQMTEIIQKQTDEIKGRNLLHEDVIDQKLPKQLISMFQALYCKLCKLTLSSPIVARDHYRGKKHQKAIDAWFIQNPQVEREPPVQKFIAGEIQLAKVTNHAVTLPDVKPVVNQQHQKPASFRPRFPSNTQRFQGPKDSLSIPHEIRNHPLLRAPLPGETPEQTRRFTFKRSATSSQLIERPVIKKARKEKSEGGGPNFDFCRLCKIQLTSQAHATQHYNGQKHKQKMKDGFEDRDRGFGIGTSFASSSSNNTS